MSMRHPGVARCAHEDDRCDDMSDGCYSSEGAGRHGYMPRSLTEAFQGSDYTTVAHKHMYFVLDHKHERKGRI